MRLSLMIPTHNSGETIERTLRSVLAQGHRPLEVLIYDEASQDETRAIIQRTLAAMDEDEDLDLVLLESDSNSGPVKAWRVLLEAASGDWCAFVWADDVLDPEYSAAMAAGAERAQVAGRKIVACSAEVEQGGQVVPYYADDAGVITAAEYSEAIFTRRLPLTQICAIYEIASAREVFDRHIQFDNPRGLDYNRWPYGNDVGFLSELAAAGEGVELLGRRLVTLVDSSGSMTRRGGREHLWQMRWQYTYNQLRVWRWWEAQGMPQASRLRYLGERRLALCDLMLGGQGVRRRPSLLAKAVLAYRDFRSLDYQVDHHDLETHRLRVMRRSSGVAPRRRATVSED